MKILITGNMGYIGPCVVKHLRDSYPDYKISGFDMGYFANCLSGTDILPECRVDVQHFGDIRDVDNVLIGDNTDAIVHLAAISNDPIGNALEKVTLDVNYRASVELARKAKEKGVRSFVYASSCSMYGAASEGGARTEESPLNPLTAYARSKISTERDLKSIADSSFTVTSLRFSTACGFSERLRLDLVLNDFVACAVTSKKITVLSDGTPWRPLINTKDMARAMDWATKRKSRDGGDFLAVNVGSDGWNYQVKDLAEAVASVIPGVDISINKNAQPDGRSYRVCFDLFRKLAPGYQPIYGIEDTIRELKNGLEEMGFADPNFRNSKFIRLNVLRDLRQRGILTEDLEWSSNGRIL